jgi:hypothetical protein
MANRVEISRNAEAELEKLYLWVVARAPQQGSKWSNGLERSPLDHNPRRCPATPESIDSDHPVRVLSYYGGGLTCTASSSPLTMMRMSCASCT